MLKIINSIIIINKLKLNVFSIITDQVYIEENFIILQSIYERINLKKSKKKNYNKI